MAMKMKTWACMCSPSMSCSSCIFCSSPKRRSYSILQCLWWRKYKKTPHPCPYLQWWWLRWWQWCQFWLIPLLLLLHVCNCRKCSDQIDLLLPHHVGNLAQVWMRSQQYLLRKTMKKLWKNYKIFTFVCTFLFRFSSSLRLLNRVRYCSTCFSVFHQQVKRYFSWTYSPDNPDLWVLHELSGETSVILFCLIVIFKSASVSAILPISIVHVYIIRGTMLNEFKRGPPPDSPPMGVQDEK